jgi:hypothetical protein
MDGACCLEYHAEVRVTWPFRMLCDSADQRYIALSFSGESCRLPRTPRSELSANNEARDDNLLITPSGSLLPAPRSSAKHYFDEHINTPSEFGDESAYSAYSTVRWVVRALPYCEGLLIANCFTASTPSLMNCKPPLKGGGKEKERQKGSVIINSRFDSARGALPIMYRSHLLHISMSFMADKFSVMIVGRSHP